MNIKTLTKQYQEQNGIPKTAKLLTDVIPKGKSIITGASGVGKTYSLIKHLNRFNIKPVLIDFDNNGLIDSLDYHFIDGYWLKKHLRNKVKDIKIEIKDLETQSKNYMLELFNTKYYKLLSEDDRKTINVDEFVTAKMTEDEEDVLNNFDSKLFNLNLDMEEIVKNEIIIENETIIIDTYAKAVNEFGGADTLFRYIDRLIENGCDVVIVSHTKKSGNKDITDVEEIYANHCDGRVHLYTNTTKTKGTETYLIIEKLRGYKGNMMIKEWMR
jgi:DNA repair ATPase RecN